MATSKEGALQELSARDRGPTIISLDPKGYTEGSTVVVCRKVAEILKALRPDVIVPDDVQPDWLVAQAVDYLKTRGR